MLCCWACVLLDSCVLRRGQLLGRAILILVVVDVIMNRIMVVSAVVVVGHTRILPARQTSHRSAFWLRISLRGGAGTPKFANSATERRTERVRVKCSLRSSLERLAKSAAYGSSFPSFRSCTSRSKKVTFTSPDW